MQYRIGNGYDVHRFSPEEDENAFVTLAGVNIAHKYSLLAHSDGDVAIHALCDALLGALALGDIGHHFPDSDEQFKGISSLLLLGKVQQLIAETGWQLANADLTIVAESPKMAPHIDAMRLALSKALKVEKNQLSIKATTTEGLGFAGREEGIAAYAVVLVNQA